MCQLRSHMKQSEEHKGQWRDTHHNKPPRRGSVPATLSLGVFTVKVWFLSKRSLKHALGTSIYLGNNPGNILWVWEQEARKGRAPVRSVLVIRYHCRELGCKALRSFWEAHPVCVLSRSVMSSSLWPHGLKPTRLFCWWNFPGKNTRAGSHSLLQGNLPNPGFKPASPVSLALAGRFFTTALPRKALTGTLQVLRNTSCNLGSDWTIVENDRTWRIWNVYGSIPKTVPCFF